MSFEGNKQAIIDGKTTIGIELGSTRIKTILIGDDHVPIATGSYDWVNSYINNVWTYDLDDVWAGIQSSFACMAANLLDQYGVTLHRTRAIGISAMMHGYLVFDKDENQLTSFRTWRNNFTAQASADLTEIFDYPIPQRWSVAHLYHAIINNESHVENINFMTTLAGYVHWQLTGKRVLGIDDASGMFPIDLQSKNYDHKMAEKFDNIFKNRLFPWKILEIMPRICIAGDYAGSLTTEGALRLDPTGQLQAGIPMCPPEGDGGTGMVACNSIAARTGNVSAGTSVFAMIVLEKELSKVYSELDLVTTPDGNLVAMVHSNNCTSDYDAWLNLFDEATKALGLEVPKPKLYDTLLSAALKGDPDCGGLLAYGYVSGEHITHFTEGRPLFIRSPKSKFTLANFMRTHLFTALGALRTGMSILIENEGAVVDEIRGHGGFFMTKDVGQKMMAAATKAPISVMKTAGEGGAWGIALLAAYMVNRNPGETLVAYLNDRVFQAQDIIVVHPDPIDVDGFNIFIDRYTKGLAIEREAIKSL